MAGMEHEAGILIIGDDALAARARGLEIGLPMDHAATAVEGLWQSGNHPYACVLIHLPVSGDSMSAVRCHRRIAPASRLVVICPASQEPLGLMAVQHGAGDYLIEPVSDAELSRVLRANTPMNVAPRPSESDQPKPVADLGSVLELIQSIGESPSAAMNRVAALIQSTLRAEGVEIEIGDERGFSGTFVRTSIEQPMVVDGQLLGRVRICGGAPIDERPDADDALLQIGRLAGLVATQATERRRWRQLAWTDDVTGLRNRRGFDEGLDALVRHLSAARGCATLLLLSLPGFEKMVEESGRDNGDQALRSVAGHLRRALRATDLLARVGEDAFAILAWDGEPSRQPASSHPREIESWTRRFAPIQSLERAEIGHPQEWLGACWGLSSFPWDGATRSGLIAAAERSLESNRGRPVPIGVRRHI